MSQKASVRTVLTRKNLIFAPHIHEIHGICATITIRGTISVFAVGLIIIARSPPAIMQHLRHNRMASPPKVIHFANNLKAKHREMCEFSKCRPSQKVYIIYTRMYICVQKKSVRQNEYLVAIAIAMHEQGDLCIKYELVLWK